MTEGRWPEGEKGWTALAASLPGTCAAWEWDRPQWFAWWETARDIPEPELVEPVLFEW